MLTKREKHKWDVRIHCKNCGKRFELVGKQCEDLFWLVDKRGLPKPFYYCKGCLRIKNEKDKDFS